MIKKYLLVLLAIAAVFAIVYLYFISSRSISVEKVQINQGYHFLGSYYTGRYGDVALEKLFFQFKEFQALYHPNKEMVLIYFNDPSEEKGRVKNFFGVTQHQKPDSFPDSLSYQFIPANSAYRAVINSHPFVMPAPEKIESMLQQKAKENGDIISNISIEKYISNEQLIVETPVLE